MLASLTVAEQLQSVIRVPPVRVGRRTVHLRPAAVMGNATVTGFGDAEPAALGRGACCAWPLPADATCAAEARRIFRKAAAGLAMHEDLIGDGVTMASELAANTLHASPPGEPVAGELWLYLRRAHGQWELACKVFDSLRGWKRGTFPRLAGASPDAVTGRGLQLVVSLSAGRWGHHPTRSRLGGWKVPGKVVWFALPVPPPAPLAPDWGWRSRLGPGEAARELAAMLADRGLGERLMVTHEPGTSMAVLSLRCGLTVWCRDRVISWRNRAGRYQQRAVTDLVDSAELIVSSCEEMVRGVGAGYPGLSWLR